MSPLSAHEALARLQAATERCAALGMFADRIDEAAYRQADVERRAAQATWEQVREGVGA